MIMEIPTCPNCKKQHTLVLVENKRAECIRSAGGCGCVFPLTLEKLSELYRKKEA